MTRLEATVPLWGSERVCDMIGTGSTTRMLSARSGVRVNARMGDMASVEIAFDLLGAPSQADHYRRAAVPARQVDD